MAKNINRWKSTLEELTKFIKEHGRLPTKYNRNGSEKKLAHWRHHNVSLYNRGLLSEERARLIESSDIMFNEDDRIWLDMLEQTKRFVELNGRYPSRFGKSAEEKKCGRWRGEQATLLRGNRLDSSRKQKFENAGLANTILDQKWNLMLKKVVQFKKKYGRMPSINSSVQDEVILAKWCYKNNRALEIKASVNPQRARLITAAGIPKSQKKIDPWQKQYDKLKEFCTKYSRLPLHGTVGDEKHLYQWYFDQLTRINKGKLDVEKANKIHLIKNTMIPPGVIARGLKWMEKYRAVSDFREKHDRLPGSSKKRIEERKLYGWLSEQKKAIKKGVLEE
jgi:hypothetical protein